ncbi:MAG TPA: FAD-dependent oxidoreductase [Candidatus Methylomirabilis sp.]|nr:FAD-dependent oxidoreductase [Candidatus Methylomirabilis sp.]
MNYDVVVAGGGAAGLAAAIAAAGCGARTALVERYGFLGGMATAGMLGTICGLYRTCAAGPAEPLNEGFAQAFARQLQRSTGCGEPVRRGRTYVLPYTPFAFACLADELATSAEGLDVYLHAYLVGIDRGERSIEALHVATWERRLRLTAGAVVDASGDAVVAWNAGAATVTTPLAERQLPSLVFVLQHVDVEALQAGPRVGVLRALALAEQQGLLPKGSSNLALGPSRQPGEVVCKLTLSGIAEEGPGRRDALTAAEQEGRKRASAITEFLRTLPPFSRSFVSHVAPQIGVRESRRVIGRYQLTREDVLTGRKFDDGVARAGWPIELWEEGHLGATYEYLPDGEAYDIPLRCLQARDVDNLLVAGRCMSASHEALGSARVIGTCLAAGEAAGREAARLAGAREASRSRS